MANLIQTHAKWALLASFMALAGCNDTLTSVVNKAEHPLPKKLVSQMKAKGMNERSPIMMRIFKEENVLEVWKQKPNGRYDLVVSYEICKWSGDLGPKFKEGDKQAPEGFYRIYPRQMNPNSSYYLSFNMGFPNSYDRSHGRTGSHLMIHGDCSSAGCYSMTDEQVLEIFGFARDAFRGGQKYFMVQAFPFRMTAENMARHRDHQNYEFWEMIREGYDLFEITKKPPLTEVCERRYVFDQTADNGQKFRATGACPPMSRAPLLQTAYLKYQKDYQADFQAEVAKLDRQADKQERALVAQQAANERAALRAEQAALRTEQFSQAMSPIKSLFSANNRQSSQNDNFASGLYSADSNTDQNANIAQTQAANDVSENVPAPQTGIPTPSEKIDDNDDTTTPFWQFWKRGG